MRKTSFKMLNLKRITAFLFSLAITLAVITVNPNLNVSAICCRKDGFNKSAYSGKLNGDPAHDVAVIATSQANRTGAQFGYTEEWCDEFVADCLELGGAASISPHGGTVQDYYEKLEKKGAKKVSASNAKVGDLAFSYNSAKTRYGHVEIIHSISNGKIYTVGGNIYMKDNDTYKSSIVYKRTNAGAQSYCSIDAILHPNYESISPSPVPTPYVEIPQDDYYLKNASTGTYLNISGGKAANGQAAAMSAKQNSNSFKFYASGSKDKGYYLLSLIDKNYALNPYSDTPKDGTKITLYKKSTDGTQLYFFEKSGSGYIIHSAYNQNLVLTPSGSNVLLKTKTGAANQVWVLETANTTIVNFHRNLNNDDTTTVSEKFTVGVANQKFGYNPDGTARYGEMNAADVGFGRWTNPGYKLLGWSTKKNATVRDWTTYSAVTDNWIKIYAPSVNLYAVWQKERPTGDLNDDKIISVSDAALLQKYLIKAEMLTETQMKYADMNGDGKVNVLDFCIMKRELISNNK